MKPASQAQIRLRMRIAYTVDGESRQDQTDFTFPPHVTA